MSGGKKANVSFSTVLRSYSVHRIMCVLLILLSFFKVFIPLANTLMTLSSVYIENMVVWWPLSSPNL